MFLFFILCLCLNIIKQCIAETSIIVTEVQSGHLVELPCLSSDDFHRFMFWQLKDDGYIIGPGSPLDENKYNYEVLTGKLYIREVSIAESGFYKCISRGIENNADFNIHIIELIVKNNLQELVENSFETNLLQSMVIIMITVVSIAAILFIILLKRRRGQQNFFDILEESRENSPEKYVRNIHSASVTPMCKTSEYGGIDKFSFDSNFPQVFQQIERK